MCVDIVFRKGVAMKQTNNTFYKKRIVIIALSNILVLLVDKIILVSQGAVGAPLIITIVLWYYIYKHKQWAITVYKIICLLSILMGVLGIFLFVGYLYRGFNPVPSLLMIIVGISYACSWLLLHKTLIRYAK